ncbi:MAG: lipoprotein LipL31 [Leptospiraceae bacterium]|nr:lipoprotein LipL31 [Leptospiraceae bacterium]
MKIQKLLLILFLTSGIFTSCNMDSSQLIESLDGEKITTKRFETAYQTALESLSRSQNIEKKNLIEIVSKDIDEVEEQLKPINYQFQKSNFYDSYRNMLMAKLAADKAGFSSRADIKDIVTYLEMQTIAQLYITEEVEKKIKITDEAVKLECEKLRNRKDDPRYRALPIDRCMMVARSYLKGQETNKALPKVLERIKEEISIKKNEKFDLEQFLKSEKQASPETKVEEPKTEKK